MIFSAPKSLSRQSSLVENRADDSDEDEFQEERAGTPPVFPLTDHRPRAFSAVQSDEHGRRFRNAAIEPDLLKEVLALKALPLGQLGRLGSCSNGSLPLITRSAPASPLRAKSSQEFASKHNSPKAEPKLVVEPSVTVVEIPSTPVRSEITRRKQKRKARLARSCVTQ